MPDNKLTDNEIVKALGICGSLDSQRWCKNCPLNMYSAACTTILMRETLALINRLTTERNNLAHNNATLVRESITMQDLMKNQKAKTYKEVLNKVRVLRNQSLINKTAANRVEKILIELVGGDNT